MTYDAYKPSGIEWIGDLPAHWEIKKLKYVADITLGKMLTNDDKGGFHLKSYLRAQNITWVKVNVEDVRQMWFSTDELKKLRIEKGDLLVSEGGEVGRTSIWDNELNECYIQNSVHRVRTKGSQNSRYYLYLFFYFGKAGHFDAIVNRISIAHLTVEKIRDIGFIAPPLAEQQAIATYLDEKTVQLDAYVARKRELIKLLIEERAGLIKAHLLIDGFPVKRLKYIVKDIVDTEHKTVPFHESGDYVVARTSDIRNGELNVTSAKRTNYEGFVEWTKRGAPEPGDVIFTREAPAGEACIVPDEPLVCLGQRTVLFKLDNNVIDPKFLVFSIYGGSASNFIQELSQGSTVAHFNMADIRDIPILLPDLGTQAQIIAEIERETSRIDETINRIEQELDLLADYRTALISEVVTGKVRVVKLVNQ